MSIKNPPDQKSTVELRKLEDVPQSSSGAPIPMVVAGEHSLSVVFYLQARDPNWDGTSVQVVGENSADQIVAAIRFHRPYAHFFGPPNEEIIDGHPLTKFGLRPFDAVEVMGSPWIEDLCKRNRVHPHHSDKMFKKYHHYILTFHDTTFEVIADGYQIEKLGNSSVLNAASKELERWQNEQ